MELTTSLDTICRIIQRARELEAQVPAENDEPDPDNVDDEDEGGLSLLEDDDTVLEELRGALDDLADDQMPEVLSLFWVGQGTFDPTEWDDALEEARAYSTRDAIDELLDMPMLAASLDSGLAAFDLSCDGVGQLD